MHRKDRSFAHKTLIWAGLSAAMIAPIVAAMMSPLLAWRSPIYILAGFAGIVALCLLVLQPVLIGSYLPGLPRVLSRRAHRFSGFALCGAVVVHVVALWITSPPDVIDALLFASPTIFSLWGVLAMWALFLCVAMVVLRKKLRLRPRVWRALHVVLALCIIGGSAAHALLIDGTMEQVSKIGLCGLAVAGAVKLIVDLRGESRMCSNVKQVK